jgi:hypothetical protein
MVQEYQLKVRSSKCIKKEKDQFNYVQKTYFKYRLMPVKSRKNVTMNLCIHCSVCSYLIQTKMSFLKNREQEGKTVPVGGCTTVREEDIRKGWRKVNMVEISCTHV